MAERDTSYAIRVPTGGGVVMAMPNVWGDPHIEWMLRYARDLNDPKAGRFTAAEIVASFDYLVSEAITMKEATRRLRLMRKARAAVLVPLNSTDGVIASDQTQPQPQEK